MIDLLCQFTHQQQSNLILHTSSWIREIHSCILVINERWQKTGLPLSAHCAFCSEAGKLLLCGVADWTLNRGHCWGVCMTTQQSAALLGSTEIKLYINVIVICDSRCQEGVLEVEVKILQI